MSTVPMFCESENYFTPENILSKAKSYIQHRLANYYK